MIIYSLCKQIKAEVAQMLKEREFESCGFLVPHWHVCGNNHTFPICFSIFLYASASFVYSSTSFSPQAELCIILNLSRKHMIMIPTSAIRLFILLLYRKLLSKIMRVRNYRELSANGKFTKSCTVSFAHVQMETLWVKEEQGSHSVRSD